MFDIFGIVDVSGRKKLNSIINPFFQDVHYMNLKFNSYLYSSAISRVFFLERKSIYDNVYLSDNMQLFILGTCFSNKHYEIDFSISPKKLSAKDVWEFYNKYEDNLIKYIKGMFTIIIIDTKKEVVKLISDRINLLPLYYYFKNNMLIFSSSLNALIRSGFIEKKINTRAIAKIAIFNYIPGNETLITNVFMQPYASIINIRKDKLIEEHYWDIMDVFTKSKDRLKKEEALFKCSQFIKETVDLYISDQKYFAVAFTGGYDSRTILAVLERDKKDYFCYSYGKNGCFDIKIPQQISNKISIDFRKFHLDEEFEDNFEKYALKAVYYSDGLGSLTKANFIYPCEKMVDSVDVILTGLCGSELIKQPTSLGYYMTVGVKNLLFSKSPYPTFNKLIESEEKKNYLNKDIFKKHKEEIFSELSENYLSKKNDKYNFFNFLFKEGIRKYFMQELKIERVFIENRPPFLDDDFIELIFKTPFAGIYNFKTRKNIVMARKTHLLYAFIIKRNNPHLANCITTHGYKPIDILSNLTMIKVLLYYYRYKYIIKKSSPFHYQKWADKFYKKYINELNIDKCVFADKIKNKYKDNEHLKNTEEFAKYFSLMLWLHIHKL